MHDDEAPTPRESGSLAVFERTCEESIERLRGNDSARADELREEARTLLVELKTWPTRSPLPAIRSEVVLRVMDLHCAVVEYVTQG